MTSDIAAPLVGGRQRLHVFVDRTLLEVYASDGLIYATLPFIPKPEDQAVTVVTAGGSASLAGLEVYQLKSSWAGRP